VLFIGWIINDKIRLNNKIINLEMKQAFIKEEITGLELRTSDDNLEKITRRVITDVFHSEEFKKEFKSTIRDTLLHIEKNRSAETVGVLSLIIEKLEKLEAAR